MPIWAVVIVAAILLHVLQWAFLPFFLAGIVAFVTDPLIVLIQRRSHAPRWVVASCLYVLLLTTLGTLGIGAGLSAWRDVERLTAGGLTPLHQTLAALLGPTGRTLFGVHLTPDLVLDELTTRLHAAIRPTTLQHMATIAFAASVGLVLWLLLSFYLMISGPKLARGALNLAPPAWRGGLHAALPQAVRIIQRYFIGILCVVVFTTLAAWIGYGLVFHVHGSLLLALAVGLLETVPIIGPALAACLVALAASQLKSMAAVLGMVVYAFSLRLIIDDVIAPVVLGRSVAVHPVVVMLAYVIGASLFGVSGLLLAVPIAACIALAAKTTYRNDRLPPDDKPPDSTTL